MTRIRTRLADAIGDVLGVEVAATAIEVPDEEFGDFAFPVMRVAAEQDVEPRQLAEDVQDELEQASFIEQVDVAGPGYLNVFLDRKQYSQDIDAMLDADRMGVEPQSGKLLLEFSSPNVAKPMHVGHFRNNALGDSLQRILEFVGYDVMSENYIGDWGTQYGKLIYAFKEYGSMDAFEEDPMGHMFDLYVRFHEEMADNEELEEAGREWAKQVEDGDEEARRLWEMFRDASIKHHEQDYERMGVTFDRVTGESTVVEPTKEVLQRGVDQGGITEDADGSLYIEFEELPKTVLKKADGTTLYLSRDIANLEKRNQEGFDYNLYVVASEQDLHFKQLFAACEKLGINTTGSEHVSYGLLDLPEGSMSSREGRIISLSELLDEAVAKAVDKMEAEEREPAVAEAVGIGAVKYANLSVSRTKNIEFEWENILSFEGDSGPYLQYANTRAKSILEKTEEAGKMAGTPDDNEYRVLKQLAAFPEVVEAAADQREPVKIANYLTTLSDTFNSFYHTSPVLQAEDEIRQRRLRIVELFVAVTEQGLQLLGIKPLDKM